METIIKRDGRKQAFSASKMKRSIEKATKEAKVPSVRSKKIVAEVMRSVVKRFKGRKSVKSTELRRAILGRLDRIAKKVSTSWRRHDRKRRK